MRILFFLWIPFFCFSQEIKPIEIDSLYREDQFYASLSYNLIQNRPEGFKQFSFSPGITFGILRDLPISKNRHWAIAPGIGYSYNNIKQFINSEEIVGATENNLSENIRTIITTHSVDFPLEIRWRNSNPSSHSFWRIYTGLKTSYVFNSKLKLESTTESSKESISDEINRWQYGAYISVGFNTWNPYIYYGLNPIFKEGSKMSNFNVGFIFYIL
ncbi:porin family protein [Flavobacterium sp.]|uniref:porin family protein n=1 Tax=Flavobacterium sp. TaxID=239 RepID=UPI003340E9B1